MQELDGWVRYGISHSHLSSLGIGGTLFLQLGHTTSFQEFLHLFGPSLADAGNLVLALGQTHGIVHRDFKIYSLDGTDGLGIRTPRISVALLKQKRKKATK
jgi:hypothetical protein